MIPDDGAPLTDILDRLRFDEVRCETQFSKGVAGNIADAIVEIERLRSMHADMCRVAGAQVDAIERLRAALKEVLKMSADVRSEDGGELLETLCKRALGDEQEAGRDD